MKKKSFLLLLVVLITAVYFWNKEQLPAYTPARDYMIWKVGRTIYTGERQFNHKLPRVTFIFSIAQS